MKRGRKKGGTNHPITETTQWCWCCQQYKPFSEFHKNRWEKSGLSHTCKLCRGPYEKEYQHRYYLEHREELLPKHNISAKMSYYRKVNTSSVNRPMLGEVK